MWKAGDDWIGVVTRPFNAILIYRLYAIMFCGWMVSFPETPELKKIVA